MKGVRRVGSEVAWGDMQRGSECKQKGSGKWVVR